MLYSKVQYNDTVQCNILQCSALQYSTIQCSAVQYSRVRYRKVRVKYNTVQYSTVKNAPAGGEGSAGGGAAGRLETATVVQIIAGCRKGRLNAKSPPRAPPPQSPSKQFRQRRRRHAAARGAQTGGGGLPDPIREAGLAARTGSSCSRKSRSRSSRPASRQHQPPPHRNRITKVVVGKLRARQRRHANKQHIQKIGPRHLRSSNPYRPSPTTGTQNEPQITNQQRPSRAQGSSERDGGESVLEIIHRPLDNTPTLEITHRLSK